MLRIVIGAFDPAGASLTSVMWVLAVMTMVLGNVMAVIQDNVKRLLAYSSVAHAGYLLIGLVTGTIQGYSAMVFYLIAYTFMTLGAFAFISYIGRKGKDAEDIKEYSGLAKRRPWAAAAMSARSRDDVVPKRWHATSVPSALKRARNMSAPPRLWMV